MSKNSIYLLVSQFLGQQNNISVPVPLVRMMGDYTAAAFASQCTYWSDRTQDPEGWFHKTHEEWLEEMHLSSDQVRRCVKSSGGVVEVKRAGVPARNYYRVNRDLLVERLQELADLTGEAPIVTASRNGETQQLEVDKPNNRPLGNPTASRTADPTSNKTKTTSKTTSKKKDGEYNVTGDARATGHQGAPVVEPGSAAFTTTDASLQKDQQGLSGHASTPEAQAPTGGAAHAAQERHTPPVQVLDQPQGGQFEQATDTEEVPGSAAGAGLDLEAALEFAPHDPEQTREVLKRALGGPKKLDALIDETPPGLRSGSRSRWLSQISPERAAELVTQGRTQQTMHPWTAITQLLDQEIGGKILRGSSSAPAATSNGSAYRHTQPGSLTATPEDLDATRWLGQYQLKAKPDVTITVVRHEERPGSTPLLHLDDDQTVTIADLAIKYRRVETAS